VDAGDFNEDGYPDFAAVNDDYGGSIEPASNYNVSIHMETGTGLSD